MLFQKSYRCINCEYESPWEFMVTHHNIQKHKFRLINAKTFLCMDSLGFYKCSFCPFEATLMTSLITHINKSGHKIGCCYSHIKLEGCESPSSVSIKQENVDLNCVKLEEQEHDLKVEDSQDESKQILFSEHVSVYYCQKCDFKSFSKVCLLSHTFKCNSAFTNNSYKCKVCNFHTNNEKVLDCHNILEHVKAGRLECSQCSYHTFRRDKMRRHNERHFIKKNNITIKDEGPISCPHCKYVAKDKGLFRRHLFNKHTSFDQYNWFVCHECGYRGKRKQSLVSHISAMHKTPEQIQWFECDQCSYKAKQKGTLMSHLASRHSSPGEAKKHKCSECGYQSWFISNIRKHMLRKHLRPEEIEWLQCEFCPYRAKVGDELHRHQVNKHLSEGDVKWFQCDLCTYKAKWKSSLQSHLKKKHYSSL